MTTCLIGSRPTIGHHQSSATAENIKQPGQQASMHPEAANLTIIHNGGEHQRVRLCRLTSPTFSAPDMI